MNKGELIDAVAESTGLSKSDAGNALDAVLDAISGSLRKGENVGIVGFGSFTVKHREARDGRNPQTNEPLRIPARNVPGFKAGKALKDAVN